MTRWLLVVAALGLGGCWLVGFDAIPPDEQRAMRATSGAAPGEVRVEVVSTGVVVDGRMARRDAELPERKPPVMLRAHAHADPASIDTLHSVVRAGLDRGWTVEARLDDGHREYGPPSTTLAVDEHGLLTEHDQPPQSASARCETHPSITLVTPAGWTVDARLDAAMRIATAGCAVALPLP